eukprot:gene11921-24972_t
MSQFAVNKKGLRCFISVVILVFWALFAFIMLENLDRSMVTPKYIRRKPAEHFFFDLLTGFDPAVPQTEYYPSSRVKSSSSFLGVIDRVLLSQYLVKRFAYKSFLQIGCHSERVYMLLPDSMSVRDCIDKEHGTLRMRPNEFFAGNLSKFGVILLEDEEMKGITPSEVYAIAEASLLALEEGGILVLTDTNPFGRSEWDGGTNLPIPLSHSAVTSSSQSGLWTLVASLRQRDVLEMVTLDADGGLTLVRLKQQQQSGLTLSLSLTPPVKPQPVVTVAVAVDSSKTGSVPVPGLGLGLGVSGVTEIQTTPVLKDMSSNITEVARVLRLMSFEEVHNWLAPTGNVDAATAFGGEKAIHQWHDLRLKRLACSSLIPGKRSTSTSTSTITKNNLGDLLVTGKANLKARVQLALLLLQQSRLVDAVTLLGELQGLSPSWNRWVWSELSSTTAQVFDGQSQPQPPSESPQILKNSKLL